MAWHVSHSKETLRTRLIEAAHKLFTTVGYDATTVEGIIRALGVSKGAFYHYFRSKEDILDAVAEEMAKGALGGLEAVVKAPLPAVEKLNRFFAASRDYKLGRLPLVRELAAVLFRDENIVLRHKVQARNIALALPLLTRIIAEGTAEGVFDTPDPEVAAQALLQLSAQWGEMQLKGLTDANASPEQVAQRTAFFLDIFERILGAPKGSIELPDMAALVKAVRARGRG